MPSHQGGMSPADFQSQWRPCKLWPLKTRGGKPPLLFKVNCLKKWGKKHRTNPSKEDVDKNITAGARWQNPHGLAG